MIESIEFKNFKALRDTTLPLGPCTILVGPNGSGKSTVLQALEAFRQPSGMDLSRLASFEARDIQDAKVSVKITWGNFHPPITFERFWISSGDGKQITPDSVDKSDRAAVSREIRNFRVFSLDAHKIAEAVSVQGTIELASDGSGLAAVLYGIRDKAPEQFRAVESQIGEWLPEFDWILFDPPSQGTQSFALRTKEGQHKVPATDLSQGTLVSLALLTLAYHPTPPSLIALEEPDRGVHPYLLRHVKDALIRLSHPESCGEKREPVQVIATTHSPYFLDLFCETPEDVVVANKIGLDVKFQRLTDQPRLHEYLQDSHLSDIWYSGILGGVPCRP